jgi:hypothetical protein
MQYGFEFRLVGHRPIKIDDHLRLEPLAVSVSRVDTASSHRQLEVRLFLHPPEKGRRPDVESRADIEDRAQGRVGLSKFDQADESSFVPGFRGQGILTHLLLCPSLPQ